MTLIESESKTINSPSEEIFNFLSDLNNHQKLMPGQVINWNSTTEDCSFTIQGTGNLSLKINEKAPYHRIRLVPAGKTPFDFDLVWEIKNENGNSIVKAFINADLNMFMKMLASGPLQNLLNYQVNQLREIFNG